jgi:biotin synthase
MSITRHNWTKEEIIAIYNKPMDFMKQLVSIENITIKRGSGFNIIVHKNRWLPGRLVGCPQAARYHTSVEGNDLMSVSQVKAQALRAKSSGSSRVCMGAAWRNVKTALNLTKYWRWFVPSTNWRWKCAALLV